jgi:hypothetical protein
MLALLLRMPSEKSFYMRLNGFSGLKVELLLLPSGGSSNSQRRIFANLLGSFPSLRKILQFELVSIFCIFVFLPLIYSKCAIFFLNFLTALKYSSTFSMGIFHVIW